MSWKDHIVSATSRTRKLIFLFKKLRGSADSKTLKTVYYSLAQSIFTYCIVVWGGAVKTFIMRLERAQRAVLKVMLNKPLRFPTCELYGISEVLNQETICTKCCSPSASASYVRSKPKYR